MPSLSSLLFWLDVALMALGTIVLAWAVVRWRRRGGDLLRGSPLRPNRMFMTDVWLCLLAYMLGAAVGHLIARALPLAGDEELLKAQRGILAAAAGQIAVIAAAILVAGQAFRRGLTGFGLTRLSLPRDAAIGTLGWLAALALCGLIVLATEQVLRVVAPDFHPPEHTVFQLLQDPATWPPLRVLALLGAALLAPAAEELLFRGILQTALTRVLPPRGRSMRHRWAAILMVAVVFGAMHSGTPHHMPALVGLGVLLGFLYERTGSLRACILLHMLFNVKSLLWYELAQQAG